MELKTAVGAALLVTLFQTSVATATEKSDILLQAPAAIAAAEFGDTLPPIGYVKFCALNARECAPYSISERLAGDTLAMTPGRWNMLMQVNTYVNRKIRPITDQELYGEPERWVYPTTAGDCEDYLLLKKRMLEKMGFEPKALRITVVLQEQGEGHAVLTVTTDEGDYVLDNRRNDILLWNDTNYTFLKRQSGSDPRRWVSLLKQPVVKTAATAANP